MGQTLSTRQKALKINLRPDVYGTFAEIGAGQEVARFFFQAGGASGTIAKSISAYDMVMSDCIYGKENAKRYVVQSRLERMLKHEYDMLIERLGDLRGKDTRFFAFADTMAALNFKRDNDPHGWLGVRFQHDPGAPSSDIIVHVRMKDNQNLHQQEAVGILGVNLIYGAFFHLDRPMDLLHYLMDDLDTSRLEIDLIEFTGPAFEKVDNRLMNLELVKLGWTSAVLFDKTGHIVNAADALYKKNIMVVRGSYRPPTNVNVDILKTGLKQFSQDIKSPDKEVTSICEITMRQLGEDGEIAGEDFLARVDLLAALGQNVLISNFPQYYQLGQYCSRFKYQNMAIVLGAYNFAQIFNEDYSKIEGGILAALGLLFREKLNIYTYPYKENESADIVNLNNLQVKGPNQKLLEYLQSSGQIKQIADFDKSILHVFSRKVLNMIVNNEDGWEKMVPESVAKTINEKCLFGHPCFSKHKHSSQN